ncbi:GH116 family glycosyl hydrolase [Actinomadura madurae]|uniref:alpha-L-rhamnosidase-related protein n=1 Tax=Actinomadura madurae TaxID=1993 RepID=UPI00202768D9|nr:alpha-L-rhamnosidase C-terminal domain-containing protein [Actinomadura madurae]URN04958.1 GH116 family glycosyl hydrolase [Actinomadura madurae]
MMVPPTTARRSLARAAVAAALTITSTAALALPAVAAPHPRGPWQDASYTPRPGQWRPYVLAPSSRDVKPVTVFKADPRQGAIDGSPESALRKGGGSVRLGGADDRAGSPLLIVDFGKEVAGHLKVRVKGTSGSPKLRACFSESVRYMALDPDANDGQGKIAPGCDTANIWNGFPGQPYTADTDSHALPLDGVSLPGTVRDTELRGGFRYATLFLDGPGSVDVDAISLDFTAAPDQRDLDGYRGHFLSSDDLLNKIWYAGAYTVQINTGAPNTAKKWPYEPGEGDHADAPVPHADPNVSVIYDGGKRDRIVWQGDLAVQAPVAYVSTYDMGSVDNSLSSLAAQQLPDGYMPAASLVGQHNQNELRTYGEYVTWFVANMYDHWWYTGDRAYLDRWWPQLTKATAWLESVRAEDDGGLIGFANSGSCGHYGYSDCGHETYVNALYARNLEQMAAMAKARGDASAAKTYADRSAAVKKAVNDQLWDDETGAYRLSREILGAYPQDGNVTAVLTGIAGGDRAKRALAYLRANNWTDIGSLTVSQSTPNASLPPFYAPLPSGFEADARLETGDASGLELIRKYWGHQLKQDPGSTFWEHMQPDGTPNLRQFSSLAHGWAAQPTVTLSSRVLGVRPAAPGYSSWAVVPFTGKLRWAEGTVPTPHGDIAASWRRTGHGFQLKVTAPRGTRGRLAVPVGPSTRRVTLDGRTVWAAGKATAHGVSSDGRYVYVDGAPAGRHTLTAH